VNGYLWLWLACPLLSACCCWRRYFSYLWGELSTHLAPQILFTQSSPVHELLLQAFLFPSTLGEVIHFLRPVCLFAVHVESWSFPLSCGVFLPPPLSQAFLLLVLGCVLLLPPGLFIYSSSALRAPHPLCYVSLLFLLLITQFLFFPWVGGWSVQEAMLFWPMVVCGSTVYCLAHLVRFFPSRLGVGIWWPVGPPGFSV
jgi:hypothetical protein